MSDFFARAKALATGRIYWCNPYTGAVEEVDRLGWRDRWNVFGVHSYNWGWVRRFGGLDCGCTRNPLTRRMVLFNLRCPEHCPFDASDAALLGLP